MVAVTTETALGVATPWMVSGAGAGTVGVFPGGVTEDGGLAAEPPPPQAVIRHNKAADPASLRINRNEPDKRQLLTPHKA